MASSSVSPQDYSSFWASLMENFYGIDMNTQINPNKNNPSILLFVFLSFSATTFHHLQLLLQNGFFSKVLMTPEFQHNEYLARYVVVVPEINHSIVSYFTLDLFQYHPKEAPIGVFLPQTERYSQIEAFLQRWFYETIPRSQVGYRPIPRYNDQVTIADIISPISAQILVEEMCKNIKYQSSLAKIISHIVNKDIIYIDDLTTFEYNYSNRAFERASSKGGSGPYKSVCAYLVKIGEYILSYFIPLMNEKIKLARDNKVDATKLESLDVILKSAHSLAEFLMGPGQGAIYSQIIIAMNEKIKRDRMDVVRTFNTINEWLPFKNNINVNVITGEIKERIRDDRVTGTCAVDWSVNEDDLTKARMYFWNLGSHDQETTDDLKCLGNIAFQGVNKHKLFPVLAGGKNCGKSTYIKALKAILGQFAITCDTAIICVSPMSRSVTQHTGTLSMLEGKRLFILDDTLGPNSNLDLNTIKNMTTPGVSTPIRDAGPGQGREMLITGIPLSAFNKEATPKGFREEGAIKERTRVIECRTEHVDHYKWEKLTEDEKQSGLYQLKNLNIDDEMLRPEMLCALAAVIVIDGG